MWSSNESTSQGGTLRRILKLVFASLVAIFLWIGFINSIPVNAAPASWDGDNISYNDQTFSLKGSSDGKNPPGIPQGSLYYVSIDGPTASVIYFASGTDTSTASNGTLKTYDYNPSTSTFSNPSSASSIELPEQEPKSSCDVGLGVGWWICPVTNMLATAMDHLFGIVTGFLEVQPLNLTDTDNNLYKAWDAMRQIANIAFIIVFLILIYSQVTSVGVSNYGIKKLLPSIIVGAILVNLSWIIAAAALDLSNILGYAMQDFFMGLRGDLFSFNTENQETLGSWASLSQSILSGSAAGVAAIAGSAVALSATGGSVTAALWLLLPALVGLILAAIVVIIIFAARQALIIILIILAPLAFIARILPNTENLYKKWYSTFMTMLVFFPAISILFGGAQLAGGLIIQNATNLNTVILGMVVQVVPLALSPFVLKLSGGLLGSVANLLNKQKGALANSTKDLAKRNAEFRRQQSLAGLNRKGEPIRPRRFTPRNAAINLNHRRRRIEDGTNNNRKLADAKYKNSEKYQDIYQKSYEGDQALKMADSVLERNLKSKVQNNKDLMKLDMDVRLKVKQAELQNLKLDSVYERMAAGDSSGYKHLAKIAAGSEEAARDLSLTAMAKNNSQRVQHTKLSDALLKNTDTIDGVSLREFAGGADKKYGADSALASAVSIQNENDNKLANERAQLISHFNLNGEQRQDLAMGRALSTAVTDDKGHSYTFNAKTDDYLRSAAVEVQFTKGSADNKLEIIESSGINNAGVKGINYDIRTSISDLIAKTGAPNSIAWLGGVSMDKITRGQVGDKEALQELAFDHIKGGRFKAEQWFSNDAVAIDYAKDVINNASKFAKNPEELNKFYKGAKSLQSKLQVTGQNDNITSRSSDGTLKSIKELINIKIP